MRATNLRKSIGVSVGLLLFVAAPPARSVEYVFPACCVLPPITAQLASRPANETKEQLIEWLQASYENVRPSLVQVDQTLLRHACSQACPENYRAALAFLESRRGDWIGVPPAFPQPFDASAVNPQVPGRRQLTTPAVLAGISANVPQRIFSDGILRQFEEWSGPLSGIPSWVRSQLNSATDDQLDDVLTVVSGACRGPTPCPTPVSVGWNALEKLKSHREVQALEKEALKIREEARRNSTARALEASKWQMRALLMTLIAALIGGICAIGAVLLSNRFAKSQAKAHASNLEAILRDLTKRIHNIERPKIAGLRKKLVHS